MVFKHVIYQRLEHLITTFKQIKQIFSVWSDKEHK